MSDCARQYASRYLREGGDRAGSPERRAAAGVAGKLGAAGTPAKGGPLVVQWGAVQWGAGSCMLRGSRGTGRASMDAVVSAPLVGNLPLLAAQIPTGIEWHSISLPLSSWLRGWLGGNRTASAAAASSSAALATRLRRRARHCIAAQAANSKHVHSTMREAATAEAVCHSQVDASATSCRPSSHAIGEKRVPRRRGDVGGADGGAPLRHFKLHSAISVTKSQTMCGWTWQGATHRTVVPNLARR